MGRSVATIQGLGEINLIATSHRFQRRTIIVRLGILDYGVSQPSRWRIWAATATLLVVGVLVALVICFRARRANCWVILVDGVPNPSMFAQGRDMVDQLDALLYAHQIPTLCEGSLGCEYEVPEAKASLAIQLINEKLRSDSEFRRKCSGIASVAAIGTVDHSK
jgi:hypothetical protein